MEYGLVRPQNQRVGEEAAPGRMSRAGGPGKSTHGRRAVPGKASRATVLSRPGRIITPLGRLVLDHLDRGVIVLDANGAVLDANLPGMRILDGRNGMNVRNDRLTFSDAAFDRRFAELIAQRRRDPAAATRAIAARLPRPRAQAYFVVAIPIPPHTDARNVAVAVFVYAPDERRDISTGLLREIYGLTNAQAEVARQLFVGRTVERTAAALRLSVNTVRTHLKQIFTKCEVQSQAELMHLLAQGPKSL
ncbi:MAG: helix-turn-helix transcriptional regulator [Gammaproteobacteria bacterium]|nr:helix-turn-helix transcriptional regulator [Gammaproteobacteria bacterium]